MKQKYKENFRSSNCDDCQCYVCLGDCMACCECYRSEFAEEDWEDFFYPYNKDNGCLGY